MSSNPSYLDVSIIKGKQIIWNIDLSKNENHLPLPIPESEEPPQTLYQLAQNYINSIYSDPHETIPDFPIHDTSKYVRKLAKKIIKYKRFSLSKLALQFNTTKSRLKSWLVKGESAPGDETNYAEMFKRWIQGSREFLTQDEMYQVINQFNKSLSKNLIKNGEAEIPAEASSQLIETVVIDNRFPPQKTFSQENINKQKISTLSLIEISASHNNVEIIDSFEWDQNDLHPDILREFSSTLVQDYIDEHHIQATEETIQALIEQVIEQIQQQVQESSHLKNVTEPLVGFNANSSSFKTKEQILQIKLNVFEKGYRINDSFDWEIDPVLNQPHRFAEVYVKENNLPISLASIISTQIEQQIALHLQKRLKNFCQLYEAKANEVPNPDNPDAQKKTNNKIKSHILLALNEPLESFPITPPFKNEAYLKNQELLGIVNKYSHLLSPMHKKILSHQKSLASGHSPLPILNGNHSKNIPLQKPPPQIIPSKIGPTQFPFQNTPYFPPNNHQTAQKFPLKPPMISAPILNPNVFHQGTITSLPSLPEENTINPYPETSTPQNGLLQNSRQVSEGYHVTFDGSEFYGPELSENKKLVKMNSGYKEEDDIFL